jgi:serine phosphatase RsbU (regulator of sigma subunit)
MSGPLNRRPRLKILRDGGEEMLFPLQDRPFTVGRRSDNELKVNDRHVSRYHARFSPEASGWLLRDLDSKLGTFVNGKRIAEHVLADGDVVTLGQSSTVRILYLDSPAESPASVAVEAAESLRRLPEAPVVEGPAEDSRDLMLLLEVAKALNSSLILSDVLNMVMDAVVRVTGAERGFLMLKDGAGQLRFRVARNFRQETLEGSGFQISRSVVENVVKNGKPEILVNVQDDPRFRNQESILALDLKTIMCVPLTILHTAEGGEARIVGVIYLDNKALSQGFSKKGLKLLESLASHAAIAIDNARLHEEALEKRRIEEELRIAHTIQERLLPIETPRVPGLDVAGWSHPSRHVGGDYFNFFPFEDGRFGFVIADVSGKGVPAALLMALLDGIFAAQIEVEGSVSETLHRVNNYLHRKSGSEKFATLFYGMVGLDRRLDYTNAGHNPPFLISPNGAVKRLTEGGLLLGAFPNVEYEEGRVKLAAGDTLVLFTDGLSEARNAQGEEFGEERLAAVARKHLGRGAEEIRAAIYDAVLDFSQGTAQHDDMTLIVLQLER